MFVYIFLYCNFFAIFFNYALHYNGVIQLNIKPNPFAIKKDLNILEQYKQETINQDEFSVPVIRAVNNNQEKEGLHLYEHKKSPYQELHYEVAKKLLETTMQGVSGIFAYYRGYAVASDIDGSIIFPRLDDSRVISIVIAELIHPVVIHGSVTDHFIIDFNAKYNSYIAENIESDESTIMKWTVKQDASLIINNKIPFQSIVNIADPDLFFFDSNPYVIDSSINILLPTLYALQNNSLSQYSNFALQVLQYYKKFNTVNYNVQIENQLHEGITIK